jgi:hypothetical protein
MSTLNANQVTKITTARNELDRIIKGGLTEGQEMVALGTALKNVYTVAEEVDRKRTSANNRATTKALNTAAIYATRNTRARR